MISIVISTWNCRRQIETCLESLGKQSYRDFEIIIVDQASTDGTLAYLDAVKVRFGLKLVWANQKLLWTEANQLGIQIASGDWIAISNPDIVFLDGSLGELAKWAQGKRAILGCNIGTNTLRRLTVGYIFHIVGNCHLGKWLDRKVWKFFFKNHVVQRTAGFQGVAEVEHLLMSFFMVPRSEVKKVLWDKRFRWACADSDLLQRARQQGLRQLYNHDILLFHEGGYSRKITPNAEYEYEYTYGFTLYAKNWLHVWSLRFLFALDAVIAPFLLKLAKQDTFTNQIECSAAKIKGLLA